MRSIGSSPARHPSLAEHWKARFGERVRRVTLDAGFSCPNRDGTLGKGGCSFCDPAAFAPSAGDRRPVGQQLVDGMDRLRARGVGKFAAYFQPHTNTYAPLDTLRELWRVASSSAEVVALCVGTRPDCVADPVLDLLAKYGGAREVWLELGLQSARDETLQRLNRGHTAARFADASRRARARNLLVCAHVILGLPGESASDEDRTAGFLTDLGVDGVKLHQLAVVSGTALETEWRRGEVSVLGESEYIERAARFIDHLPERTVLHRIVGDTASDRLLAPRYDKGRATAEIWRRVRGEERGGGRGEG